VVWLNETQLYLDTPGDTGERVAAALQTVLSDPGRGPVLVLVLGTLWSAHRDALTREDTGHPQARKILDSGGHHRGARRVHRPGAAGPGPGGGR
jgi:hypothetical protein